MFGFKNAKYDLNLINYFSIAILVNERDIEPTVIKKAEQSISFNFCDNQLLDIKNILGGAASSDSFLKAYKTLEKNSSPTNGLFDHPNKMQNTEIPPVWRLLQ